MTRARLVASLLTLLAIGPAVAGAGSDTVPDGEWISARYADALLATRSPIAAANRHAPLALSVVRPRNGPTRIDVTSFHETRRLAVVRVDAGAGPRAPRLVLASAEDGLTSQDVVATAEFATVDEQGVEHLQTALSMDDQGKTVYRRVPVRAIDWATQVLLAGTYVDAQGRPWQFGTDMNAVTPEGRYPYHVALDPSEAGCDYFETPDASQPGGERRVGFAWQQGRLQLFRIEYREDAAPISCASKPFVVLTRQTVTATPAAKTACRLATLPIVQKARGDWTALVSRAKSFSIAHENPGGKTNPDVFTEGPIRLTHADGSTCEFDPSIYGREFYVSHDERTLAVVSYSGSASDLLFVDVETCRQRESLDVFGSIRTEVDGDVIRYAGDCEMSDPTRGSCVPASVWRLDTACHPVRLEEPSIAWTRERFGVAFIAPSEVMSPFTAQATWLGPRQP